MKALAHLMRILGPLSILAAVTWWLPIEDLGLVSRADKKAPVRRKDSVDFREAIAEIQPKVVFLGNSILGRAIDEELWNQLVDVRTLKMQSAGSASAMWFILLKNVLGRANPRPDIAVVFFRDIYLTEPAFRVYGEYEKRIFFYCDDQEVELNRVLYFDGVDHVDFLLERHWSLYQRRDAAKENLESYFKNRLVGWLTNKSKEHIRIAVASTFAEDEMATEALEQAHRGADLQVESDTHFDFEKRVHRSFLPSLIDTAEQLGIHLILVRMRTVRDATEEKEGRDAYQRSAKRHLPPYTEALRQYVEQRGVGWLNFAAEEALLEEHFTRGDHFNEAGAKVFTKLFAERLKPHLTTLR